MLKYILKRVGLLILTLWLITSLTYLGMLAMPGDPYKNLDKLTNQEVEQLNEINGFNRPVAVQYVDYMGDLLLGENFPQEVDFLALDFGRSFQNDREVVKEITKAYPVSFIMGICALLVGTVVGIALGLAAALKKNSVWDYMSTLIAVIGVSFPSFVLAAYMQYFLAVQLNLFPTSYQQNFYSLILPILALSVFATASVARVTRTEMVELSSSNFILLARAKGVSNDKVILKHAFRNALVSILTILGPLAVSLTTGSLVIEKIFSIPGIGGILTKAVLTHDIYVVCGVTFFISFQILVMYLIVDILYVFVDPRIKVTGGSK